MATIKLTTWNIEHFAKLLADPTGDRAIKLSAAATEIAELAPDILCIIEGPGDLVALREWVASPVGLGGAYHVATMPGTDALLQTQPADVRKALQKLYAMQGTNVTGNQWIWFLVRDGLFQESEAQVLPVSIWQDLTRQPKWRFHDHGAATVTMHSHWRHPQTLLLDLGGVPVEIIGAHLKSKINQKDPFTDDSQETLSAEYVREALRARARLATEAYDIRRYIERRFDQEPHPRIFVCGDLNDGPGRGYFEREYLYFDLVSNVQGDVFNSQRFLNHALFDFDDALCWSTQFSDRVERWARLLPGADLLPSEPFDPTRAQLIDHILFTQALVGAGAMPRVEAGAGLVEHTTHQRVNAPLLAKHRTSDHAPVSVHITV